MKFSKMILSAFVVAILAGCGAKSDGNDYVGKWQNIDPNKSAIAIERNGEKFVFLQQAPSFADAKKQITLSYPATIDKDGNLVVISDLGATTFSIDKKTGYFVGRGNEFKKMN